MRVAFHTLGCKINYSETSTAAQDVLNSGHEVVASGQECDVFVINTCSVTDSADSECAKIIKRQLRVSPLAKVVVTGCTAQLRPEVMCALPGVVAVVGAEQKHRIAPIINEIASESHTKVMVGEMESPLPFRPSRTMRTDSRTRVFLKVQDGCDYSCSFCTIPMARGSARAMSRMAVQQELERIAAEGYHEVVLGGINLGEYRTENDERFIDLLHMIERMAPPFRVRISSIEPNTLSQDIINLISSSKYIVPHLHIPLQSGSADVLKRMRRRYTPERYKDTITRLTDAIPGIAIGIDVIVGFPGETENHFRETVKFLEELPFTYLHVFTYSERPNTPAAEYEHSVPVAERRRRTRVLRDLSEQRTRAFHQNMVGTEHIMIPEGYDAERGVWTGWTENHIACMLSAPSSQPKQPYRVRCMEAVDNAVRVERVQEYIHLPVLELP